MKFGTKQQQVSRVNGALIGKYINQNLQNVNTLRNLLLFSPNQNQLNWQADLSIYYLYDYACDFCILKRGSTLQVTGVVHQN